MNPYSRYEDALLAKLRIHEWYSSYEGDGYLRGFFEHLNSQHVPEERLDVSGLVYMQKQMIKLADPIYVSSDITEIVDHARWSFETEALLPGDPFTSNGFAIFPKPIMLDDAPTREDLPGRFREGVPVRAVGWMAMHSEDLSVGCYWISFYVHVDDDFPEERGMEGEKLAFFRRHAPLSLVHQWQWTWGKNPTEMGTTTPSAGETQEQADLRARQQSSFVQTFWRIGQQKVPTAQRVPRGIWKDAKRKGLDDRDVKIMLLRRSRDYEHNEDTGRTMKVRSITNGHWRNQWYSSIQEHRQIWIFPYVRGPEDAPFINPDRMIEFKR